VASAERATARAGPSGGGAGVSVDLISAGIIASGVLIAAFAIEVLRGMR
jgi:hypothetical protein